MLLDEPKPLAFDDFRRFERGFWLERESLQNIYMAALAGMCAQSVTNRFFGLRETCVEYFTDCKFGGRRGVDHCSPVVSVLVQSTCIT